MTTTTTLAQGALLPRAGFVANSRGAPIDVRKAWNGAFCRRTRVFCDDRKQGCTVSRRQGFGVTRCGSAEKAAYAVKEVTDEDFEKQLQPSDTLILAAIRSSYNYITVMEVSQAADHLLAGARLLLLDIPGCIHTVYYEHSALTHSYYDALATVVPLLPPGPVGILGLGAGATAHVLHHFFPARETHCWELDPDIVAVARKFFNLSALEDPPSVVDGAHQAKAQGKLTVHIGDALGEEVGVEGGFAGLIVDLFAEGRVIAALQEARTWEKLKEKLKPGGRIIVNCGGERVIAGEPSSQSAGQLYMEQTIAAMKEVFAGDLSSRYLARKGFNTIAVTGPPLDLEKWSRALPEPLRDGITDWKPVS